MVEKEVRLLKALADETRFRIVLFLLKGKQSVSDIVKHTKKAQPTVSLQLKLLQLSGVIKSERKGKQIFYSVADPRIFKLVETLGMPRILVENEVKLLKALADETRLRIILFILKGKKAVSEIVKHTQKAQPTISLQLKLLNLSNIIRSERKGKQIFYSVADPRISKIIKVLGVTKE